MLRPTILLAALAVVPGISTAISVSRADFRSVWRFLSPKPPVHELHLTQSRVIVGERQIEWRVRVFADDVEKALRAFLNDSSLTVTTTPAALATFDLALTRYFNAKIRLHLGGVPARATLGATAREHDLAGGAVLVATFRFARPSNVNAAAVYNGLLFDTFDDQQNLMSIVTTSGRKLETLYFTTKDTASQSFVLR